MSVPGGSQYQVYGKTHYQRNKAEYLERATAVKRRNRQYVRGLKESGSCVDCGISDWRVLDYDHLPGSTKVKSVSALAQSGVSLATIAAEIAKCDLRCANCHRIITIERNAPADVM